MAKIYTVKETAEILRCNVNRVYELIEAGLLPAVKIGRLKIREEAITELLENYEGKDISDPDDVRQI